MITRRGAVVEATLITTLIWTEKLKPLAAQLIFDWQAVHHFLQASRTTPLTDKSLKTLAQQALARQMIMLKWQSDAREVDSQMREWVIEWIVAELKRKLLAPSEQNAQHLARNALWTYQVRNQLRTEFFSSVLSLNVTSYLERAETVVSKMPILF
jgi:hypothetical protein